MNSMSVHSNEDNEHFTINSNCLKDSPSLVIRSLKLLFKSKARDV